MANQLTWRKSSYSALKTECVEVAPMPNATGIRDSKNIDGGELHVPRTVWRAFVREITAD